MNLFTKTALALVLSAGLAQAHEFTIGDITIDHPMAFETAKSANVGGGYMSITNNGSEADTLVSVTAEQAPMTELHLSETDANGVARMIKQDGIEIPAGQTVMLKPGGLHVMFMGLTDPFERDQKIDATLTFEKAGDVDVVFSVEERSANDHGSMDHSNHDKTD